MKPSLLSLLISSALLSPLMAQAQSSPSDATPEPSGQAQAKRLDTVRVTGSLIPRPQIEGPSPTTSITSEQIEAQGFTNLFDALRSLPQSNGSVQDSQGTGNYTPGAKTISLFGLDPSYTLTLLNGRPMANYPLAYNGNTSIVDIANIPLGMIDRVDVLTGGQSSVYGSSAIAGVVNVILKDKVEGTHLRYRSGGYSDGGGSNQRFIFSSGQSIGNLDISYGLELSKQKAIHASDRSYIDSLQDSPSSEPVYPSRLFLRQNQTAGAAAYMDPGAGACDNVGYMYGGSTGYAYRDVAGGGFYCGSYENVGAATLLNASKNANASLFLRYHLTPQTEIYSDILYSYSSPTYSGGMPSWNKSFYNQTTGSYELWQRIYSPEEVGIHAKDQRVYTRSYNAVFGVRGPLVDTGFDYDVYFNRSESTAIRKATDFLANNGVDAYYLGPLLGTDAAGYDIYAPNLDRLYQPITQDLYYNQFSATNRAESNAWTQNVTATLSNLSLFELPAGPVGFAAIIQGQQEEFSNQSTAPNAAELFRGGGGSTTASGSRDLYAIGAEFQVPILDTLSANLSGRYDKYHLEGGGGNGKATYKLGIEYRPIDTLLLRGSYATAFRSPDMFYLYSRQSSGYSSATDYYQCRSAGFGSANYDDCPQADNSVLSSSTGNRDLKDITAKTFTYGFVWSALDNALSLAVDYNSVKIENEVRTLGTDSILETEGNCRLGVSDSGVAFDINSPTCQQVMAQVTRRPADDPVNPNGVVAVSSYPINLASQRQDGVQATLDYRWKTARFGDFAASFGYYRTLKHEIKEKDGDPVYDQLCCNNSNELHYRATGSLTWNIGSFVSTLYGIRNAATWNQAGDARDIGPWTTWNTTVGYRFNPSTSVLLTVNNLGNERPPTDRSNAGWPYYDQGIYNAYGRSVSLELSVDFGG